MLIDSFIFWCCVRHDRVDLLFFWAFLLSFFNKTVRARSEVISTRNDRESGIIYKIWSEICNVSPENIKILDRIISGSYARFNLISTWSIIFIFNISENIWSRRDVSMNRWNFTQAETDYDSKYYKHIGKKNIQLNQESIPVH